MGDRAEESAGNALPVAAEDGRRTAIWPLRLARKVTLLLVVGAFYLFGILVLGLIGAYFANIVDGVLAMMGVPFAGHARPWGWVLGALLAAIGMPLRWMEINGKKLTLRPKPSRRHTPTTPESESCSVKAKATPPDNEEAPRFREVFKMVGIFGLIGLMLGALLGGVLAMAWFSLAMSPLAPEGWFESIQFGGGHAAGSDFSDDTHADMTTKHPLVLWLFLSPMAGLAALGVMLAIIYAIYVYARHLARPAARRTTKCAEDSAGGGG
jgi:hypothetical protein